MKRILALILALVFCLGLMACSKAGTNTDPSTGTNTSTDKPSENNNEKVTYKIGIIAKNYADAFTGWQAKLMYEKAQTDYDCFDVSIIDCEGSIEKEISAVETFIAQGCKVILWQVSDSNAALEIAETAHNAGVVLLTLSNVISDEYSYAIKSDQVQEGEIIGSYLAKVLPENANVLICRAPDGSNYGNNRTLGVTNTLFNVRSDVTLLEEKPADWDRAKAMALMEDWLTVYDQIDAVVCHNDSMALGCVEAIKNAGRLDEIMVFGIDGLPEAVWSVSNSELTGTVVQDAITQSDVALELAYKILVENTPPADRVTVIDGELICQANENIEKWIQIHKDSGNWTYSD